MHHGCDKAWLELQSRLVVAEDGGGGRWGRGRVRNPERKSVGRAPELLWLKEREWTCKKAAGGVRGGVHIALAENRERVGAGANASAAVTGASALAPAKRDWAAAARLRGARGAAFGRQATAQRPEMLTWLGNWTPPRGLKLRLRHAPACVRRWSRPSCAADGRYIWPLCARQPILRRAYPRATTARPPAFPLLATISRTSANTVMLPACRACGCCAFPRRSIVGQRTLSTLQVHAGLLRPQPM